MLFDAVSWLDGPKQGNKEPTAKNCCQVLWMPGKIIKTCTTVKHPWHQGQSGGSPHKRWECVAQVCPILRLLNTTSCLTEQHGGGQSE